jgi:hypothetical protein
MYTWQWILSDTILVTVTSRRRTSPVGIVETFQTHSTVLAKSEMEHDIFGGTTKSFPSSLVNFSM